MSRSCGSIAFSSVGPYGTGESFAATRRTGASRCSNASARDQRGDLCAEPAGERVFVDDQRLPGFPDRLQDRLLVERVQRPEVDHFDADAVVLEAIFAAASSDRCTSIPQVITVMSAPCPYDVRQTER